MRALAGGGVLLRFLVSGVTAILVVSTLSLAISLFSGPAGMSGRAVADEYDVLTIYATEIAVGMLTFAGSFRVVSRRKKL